METVTARLVGMETNVNSSVTSARGRASGDAHHQMARSAATEVRVCVESAPAMMWTRQATGEISTATRVSATREAATPSMTDTLMTSAQVMVSVTVGGATAARAGPGRSASIRSPARSLPRPASASVGAPPTYPALEEDSACVANVPASLQETAVFMERTVSVMTASVRT